MYSTAFAIEQFHKKRYPIHIDLKVYKKHIISPHESSTIFCIPRPLCGLQFYPRQISGKFNENSEIYIFLVMLGSRTATNFFYYSSNFSKVDISLIVAQLRLQSWYANCYFNDLEIWDSQPEIFKNIQQAGNILSPFRSYDNCYRPRFPWNKVFFSFLFV